jgi:inhibitor of KinA sporulation pathway (predicted exonuclease)
MLRAQAFPVPKSVSNLMETTNFERKRVKSIAEYKSRSILSSEDQGNQFMKTNGNWDSIEQLQNCKKNDSPGSKRPLTAYYNSIRTSKKSIGALSMAQYIGKSERLANKKSLKEGNQAMQEIKNFEKKNGLKKLGPPVNKYPQVLLEAHYEMGKKFFSNQIN